MPDPTDPAPTPPQGTTAAQGAAGNGARARVAELERALAERDATVTTLEQKLREAADASGRFEREARAAFDDLRAERDRLAEDNARLAEDNARLRETVSAARRAAAAPPERLAGRDDPRRWRALSRLCATVDGKAQTFAADSTFVARQSDLEDDGLALGVDFAAAPPEPAAGTTAPGR